MPTDLRALRVQAVITDKGSLRKAASRLGVHPGFLSHVMNGSRQPGPKLMEALGLEAVISYRRRKDRP